MTPVLLPPSSVAFPFPLSFAFDSSVCARFRYALFCLGGSYHVDPSDMDEAGLVGLGDLFRFLPRVLYGGVLLVLVALSGSYSLSLGWSIHGAMSG